MALALAPDIDRVQTDDFEPALKIGDGCSRLRISGDRATLCLETGWNYRGPLIVGTVRASHHPAPDSGASSLYIRRVEGPEHPSPLSTPRYQHATAAKQLGHIGRVVPSLRRRGRNLRALTADTQRNEVALVRDTRAKSAPTGFAVLGGVAGSTGAT